MKIALVGYRDWAISIYNNISKNSEATDYKTGLNYIFHENCRAQINYLYSDYSKAWKTADNHSIAIQLQVVF